MKMLEQEKTPTVKTEDVLSRRGGLKTPIQDLKIKISKNPEPLEAISFIINTLEPLEVSEVEITI